MNRPEQAAAAISITLGDRIRIARDKRDIDQVDLADMIGVSDQTIRRWEHGDREPKATQIMALANALNVRAAWLLGDDTVIDLRSPSPSWMTEIMDQPTLFEFAGVGNPNDGTPGPRVPQLADAA